MYAVIESGGQQHKVQVNAMVTVDRLAVPEGGKVHFDRVLLLGDEEGIQVGTPTVADAVVRGRVVKHLRGRKIRGFKYKPKKRYRRRFGYRSDLTQVWIEAIETGGTAGPAAGELATAEATGMLDGGPEEMKEAAAEMDSGEMEEAAAEETEED